MKAKVFLTNLFVVLVIILGTIGITSCEKEETSATSYKKSVVDTTSVVITSNTNKFSVLLGTRNNVTLSAKVAIDKATYARGENILLSANISSDTDKKVSGIRKVFAFIPNLTASSSVTVFDYNIDPDSHTTQVVAPTTAGSYYMRFSIASVVGLKIIDIPFEVY